MRAWVVVLVLATACRDAGHRRMLGRDDLAAVAAPPGALGRLHVGMPADEARRLAPDLAPRAGQRAREAPTEFGGVDALVTLTDDLSMVETVAMRLSEGTDDLLASTWGSAATQNGQQLWFDPAARRRARLVAVTVHFEPYLPIRELITSEVAVLSFEDPPLIGAPISALDRYADLPGVTRQATTLAVLPTEWEPGHTNVRIETTRDGTAIAGITVSLFGFDVPGFSDNTFELFTERWGPAGSVVFVDDPQPAWVNARLHRRAMVLDTAAAITVRIGPCIPLAELLGTEPARFGFEKPPVLGATREELRAGYGSALIERDQGISIELPPTEYYGGQNTHAYLGLDARGRIDRISLAINYDGRSETRDQLAAVLAERVGAAHDAGSGRHRIAGTDRLFNVQHGDRTWWITLATRGAREVRIP